MKLDGPDGLFARNWPQQELYAHARPMSRNSGGDER